MGEMLRDRSLMVSLFQKCGKAEFKFLVNRCVKTFLLPCLEAKVKRRIHAPDETAFRGLPRFLDGHFDFVGEEPNRSRSCIICARRGLCCAVINAEESAHLFLFRTNHDINGLSPFPSPPLPFSPPGQPQSKTSGFFFGFLLGVVQMFVWLLYDKPWILPAGGAVVGYITNWLAIKLIFEPVDPVKMGPFVLQGLFLKRQDEVSR